MKIGSEEPEDWKPDSRKAEADFRQTGSNRKEQEGFEPGEPAKPVSQTGNTTSGKDTSGNANERAINVPVLETEEESRERQLKYIRDKLAEQDQPANPSLGAGAIGVTGA